MNDDDVISKVRSAVSAQVDGVRADPPALDTVPYTAPVSPVAHRRSRWILPAGLAAAAAVALGVVLVARGGDDRSAVDTATTLPATSTRPPQTSTLERWLLDLPGAELIEAGGLALDEPTVGTNVFYVAGDGTRGAVARTNGASIALSRSSWPTVDTVTVLGVQAARYRDPDQELLVVPTDPALIVETYGGGSSADLAASARLVDGVWQLADSTYAEVGRAAAGDPAPQSESLHYRFQAEDIWLDVVAYPGGLEQYLLDHGLAPGQRARDENGENWLTFGTIAVNDAPTGDVVIIRLPQNTELAIPGAGSTAVEVDEATWRAAVAAIGSSPTTTTSAPGEPPTVYRAVGTVIEVAGQGVSLCLGAVLDSLPPQCGGTALTIAPETWRWPAGTFEERNGVRWASYVVEGAYDGATFTVTADPRVATPADFPVTPTPDFSTPCPEPAGGWLAAGANAPTGAAYDAVSRAVANYIGTQPDSVGLWYDTSLQGNVNGDIADPTKVVLNASFTGDVERHRSELAAMWKGALCVSQSTGHPFSQVQAALIGLQSTPGFLTGQADPVRGVAVATFVLVTPELEATLAAKYGAGVVDATSALTPVP